MAKNSSKAEQPSVATKREPPFRLACVSCDRGDYDGVYRLPQNWTEIQKVQSLAESKEPVENRTSNRSLFDWHTHTGYCPECQKAEL